MPYYVYLLNIAGNSIVSRAAEPAQLHSQANKEGRTVMEFNHIHIHEEGDWVCGRSMAYGNQELLRCEARDSDEQDACRRCAEQMLAYFGEPMHVH